MIDAPQDEYYLDPNKVIRERDIDRKRVGFASMQAKLALAKRMIESAERVAGEAVDSFANQNDEKNSQVRPNTYCQTEATYAAVEDAISNLELVQILCVKLAGINPIPPLEKFAQAIERGGPPLRNTE